MSEPDAVIFDMRASTGRRVLGIGALWALAGLLGYVVIVHPPEWVGQIFLFAFAGGAAWLAEAMRKATTRKLALTALDLREEGGDVLCALDQVRRVDRTMFAFKPSNGFLVTTREPGPFTWRPGLWWRIGRRIGVGGLTPAAQAKYMADMISAMVAERKSDEESEA